MKLLFIGWTKSGTQWLYLDFRQLVEETMQGHKNAKEAKKKLKEYKQRLGRC